MSENYIKHAIRIILKELKNKTIKEQLEWFEERFGRCKWVNIAADEIECFDYNDFKNKPENIEIVKDDRGNYGIDIIIQRCPDYKDEGMNLDIDDIISKTNEVIKKYNIKKGFSMVNMAFDVRIVSYTWYTGSDEPCVYGLEGCNNK